MGLGRSPKKGLRMAHEGHRARLRERYRESGISGLLDHEALELLLTYAIPRRDTKPMAHALLDRFGTLQGVMQARPEELCRVAGVGDAAALLLRLTGELNGRIALQEQNKKHKPQLKTALDAARYASALMAGERYECVYVISLDVNRRVLHATRIHGGSLTETPIYPRTVVEEALLQRAHAALLVHNHPSGDPLPSGNDVSVTESVGRALAAVEIQLFDHIITGDGCCYSLNRGITIDIHAQSPVFEGARAKLYPPEELPAAAEMEHKGEE